MHINSKLGVSHVANYIAFAAAAISETVCLCILLFRSVSEQSPSINESISTMSDQVSSTFVYARDEITISVR